MSGGTRQRGDMSSYDTATSSNGSIAYPTMHSLMYAWSYSSFLLPNQFWLYSYWYRTVCTKKILSQIRYLYIIIMKVQSVGINRQHIEFSPIKTKPYPSTSRREVYSCGEGRGAGLQRELKSYM